jgi:hypothetical protein
MQLKRRKTEERIRFDAIECRGASAYIAEYFAIEPGRMRRAVLFGTLLPAWKI